MVTPTCPSGCRPLAAVELGHFYAVAFRGNNITMNDTPPQNGHPTAQAVVQTHRSVLRRITEALRKGTGHARWYADHMDEDIDRALGRLNHCARSWRP